MERWFLIVLASLTACSHVSGSGGWGTAHEMIITRVTDPATLNPLFASSQADIDLTQLYAEPLIGLTPANELMPIIADRVPTVENGDVSRDGRAITYHLRHDERFADGVPLTSKDVAFTYRAILDPRNPVTEVQPYRIVERLETPDSYTVVMRLRRPWGAAASVLFAESDSIFGILPAHAFLSTDVRQAAWNEHPFGSGPFRVVQWHRGDDLVLTPNPYARRRAHLRRLILKIVPDAETAFLQLRTRAVDVMDGLTDLQAAQARSISDLKLVRTQKNNWDFLVFNTRRPPTEDIRIRRALLEAIDTRSIARKILYNEWPLATTEIPPMLWAHDAAIPAAAYDPRDAMRRLRGKHLDVEVAYIARSRANRAIATMVQAGLATVGVRATLRAYPQSLFFRGPNGIYGGGHFNLALAGWLGGSDPEQSEFLTCDQLAPSGPNAARWCDPRYDRLFSEQSRLLNRSARTAVFYKMQHAIHDAALFVPLVYRGSFSAVNPAVRGWRPDMLFEYSKSEDWDVTPLGS